eukprot:2610508-Pleurochrysis_carterae.AAC.4
MHKDDARLGCLRSSAPSPAHDLLRAIDAIRISVYMAAPRSDQRRTGGHQRAARVLKRSARRVQPARWNVRARTPQAMGCLHRLDTPFRDSDLQNRIRSGYGFRIIAAFYKQRPSVTWPGLSSGCELDIVNN